MKDILALIFPIIPLLRSLKDRDRRFYVFIEQPLISVLVTFASLYISEELTHTAHSFNPVFIRNFLEVYLSYQLANIIRDGVNTDAQIRGRIKLLLNWYYSVLSYVIFTAVDRLARAKTEEERVFAWGIVIFSILWPIFSQTSSTYIWTPILFSKFPKRTLLIKLSDISLSLSELLKDEKDYWNIKWIYWFRKSNTLKLKMIQYWLIKTVIGVLIGVLMTTVYYLLRWNLVGVDSLHPQILTKFIGSF